MNGLYSIFTRDLGEQQYIVDRQPMESRFAPGQLLVHKVEPVANPLDRDQKQAEGWRVWYTDEMMTDEVATRPFALVDDNGVRPFRTNTNRGRAGRINELLLFAELEGAQAQTHYARKLERLGTILDEDGPRLAVEMDFHLLWGRHAQIVADILGNKLPHVREEVPAWFRQNQ